MFLQQNDGAASVRAKISSVCICRALHSGQLILVLLLLYLIEIFWTLWVGEWLNVAVHIARLFLHQWLVCVCAGRPITLFSFTIGCDNLHWFSMRSRTHTHHVLRTFNRFLLSLSFTRIDAAVAAAIFAFYISSSDNLHILHGKTSSLSSSFARQKFFFTYNGQNTISYSHKQNTRALTFRPNLHIHLHKHTQTWFHAPTTTLTQSAKHHSNIIRIALHTYTRHLACCCCCMYLWMFDVNRLGKQ